MNQKIVIVMLMLSAAARSSEGVSITSNIEDNLVCPGEELVLTCTDQNTFLQRWTIESDGVHLAQHTFRSGHDQSGASSVVNSYYYFRLASISYDHFESIFSTTALNNLNTITVKCTGTTQSGDTATITIQDEPSPPQNLNIQSVEHHSNYSTVVVIWEPARNDSRVDFYQYKLINSLTEVRVSNTTNTTAILSGVPYNVNISFVISAYNCERESEQATLLINIAAAQDSTTNVFGTIATTVYKQQYGYTSSGEHMYTLNVTPSAKDTNTLLFGIYVFLSTMGVVVMYIACLIVTLVFVRQVRKTRQIFSTCENIYFEHEIPTPVYEMVGNAVNEPNIQTDLSLGAHENVAPIDECEVVSGANEGAKEENVGVSLNTSEINVEIDVPTAVTLSSQPQPCPTDVHIDEYSLGSNRSNYDDFVYPHFRILPISM